MREIILALAIPLAALIASPAMAVKVVVRDAKSQQEQPSHQADSPSAAASQDQPQAVGPATDQAHDPGVRHDDRPNDQPSKGTDSSRIRRAGPAPEPSKGGPCGRRDIRGNDNFIDENHDGIDDRLQRPPEVIKKKEPKREHAPERQAPQRSPEKERKHVRDHEREQVKRTR